MELRFTYQRFFTGANDNTKHFLIKSGTLQLTLTFHDNTELIVNVPQRPAAESGFVARIDPAFIPDLPVPLPGSGLRKKQIVRIRSDYRLLLDFNAKRYQFLHIGQVFAATPGEGHSDTNLVYTLAPAGWVNAAGALKVGNSATHPLVKLDKLASNEIRLNALVVNLTELWDDLHQDNTWHAVLRPHLSNLRKMTYLVFGNLAGNAFIWYASVPRYLASANLISPHVFFAPSDNAELQNKPSDRDYLLNNQAHLKRDGRRLFTYLWPPVADTALSSLPTTVPIEVWKRWRNTVAFEYIDAHKTKIATRHWLLAAGLEKAFYAEGNTSPKQFLLIPQNIGQGAQSVKGIQTLGPADALHTITSTIALVLQTNTTLLAAQADGQVAIDTMVLSAYSEGGFDLWIAIRNNMKRLKAVIAIEPQNMNTLQNDYGVKPPLGIDVLPPLLKLGQCKVFVVGRAKYKPAIPNTAGITFMPPNPDAIFKYPPDPSANPFVRLRVERMTNSALDPLMQQHEMDLLNDLAGATPPLTGQAALAKIFHPWNNVDCTCATPRCECTDQGRDSWYSHQFALSGGQIMTLPPAASIYNQPISYRTFFQEAVELIG